MSRFYGNWHYLIGWMVFIMFPALTTRLAAQTSNFNDTAWAQLKWLARAMNGRKLGGASCTGNLGAPAVTMLG